MNLPAGKPADLSNPVPDIGECMVYTRDGRTEHMRVTGWYCLKPVAKPEDDHASQIITEILREENAVGFVLVPCTRAEATVIGLYAVGSALVRINDAGLTREGAYVPWSEELLKSEADSWLNFHCKHRGHAIGRDHRDLLTRLFPEVDFSYPY